MADALNTGEQSLKGTERRAHPRHRIRSLAYVELDQDNGGIVLDACEGGLAVQAAMSLMDQPVVKVRLQAPQSKAWIEAGARIVWVGDKRKRAGLQFTELSDDARNLIRQWLSSEGPGAQSRSSVGVSPGPATPAPPRQPDKAVGQPANRRPTADQAANHRPAVDQPAKKRPAMPPPAPPAPSAPPANPAPAVEFVLGSNSGSAPKSGYLLYADPLEHSSTLPRNAAEPPATAAPPVKTSPRSAEWVPPSVNPSPRSAEWVPPSVNPSPRSAEWVPPAAAQKVAPAPPVASVPPVAALSHVQPKPEPSIFDRPRPPIFERAAPRMWSGELSPSTYDMQQDVAGRLPRLGLLIGLVAALIVLSLGAGWAAGRGVLDGIVHEVQAIASRGTSMVSDAAAPTPSTPTPPTPSASAPVQPAAPAPTPAPAPSTQPEPTAVPPQPQPNLATEAPPRRPADAGSATPATKPSPSWMQPSLSLPITQRQQATGREALVAPPAVELSSGPGNIVLSYSAPPTVLPVPRSDSRSDSHIGTLQRGSLVRRVSPIYPESARQQRVEGTVKLHVIVGVNGAIRRIDFISGPKMLAASAENAVSKWLYAPSLMDGRPIEMEYEVSLAFQLPPK